MSLILCIETGTDICSVGIARDGELISLRESDEGRDHAKRVGVFVDELLRETGVLPDELDAVAVGMGPGSYTGLRIGVSFAKGLCYALDIPLIAIGSLDALAEVAREDFEAGILDVEETDWTQAKLCPMVDARRMEVYAAVYDRALNVVKETAPVVVDDAAFADLLEKHPVYFFGNGADKCEGVIEHPNAHFIDGIKPVAKNMMPLAEREHAMGAFQDVAYFEPFYLKDFVAIKSNKVDKIIRG